MLATMDIAVNKVEQSKLTGFNLENLPFGKFFTDHMLEADFENGEWKNIEIKPYQPLLMNPSLASLHYGQAIFEGIKAYKDREGGSYIFRPYDNFKRFNVSAERMAMPPVPEELFMSGLLELLKLDAAWVPTSETGSLYIRPFSNVFVYTLLNSLSLSKNFEISAASLAAKFRLKFLSL